MSIFEALGGPTYSHWEDPDPPRYKLDNDQAVEIRRLYATGVYRQVDLAREYGVSQPQISKIVNNKQRRQP